MTEEENRNIINFALEEQERYELSREIIRHQEDKLKDSIKNIADEILREQWIDNEAVDIFINQLKKQGIMIHHRSKTPFNDSGFETDNLCYAMIQKRLRIFEESMKIKILRRLEYEVNK